ncbi:MAG: hypothetical protein IJ292_05325 [Clostridia bacterium]|nr:hypothetical protein [Clostridia bacterium]
MIHFNPNLVSQAIKIAHEAQELSDVLNDLNRINAALSAVTSIENLIRARMLDKELREKYSTINKTVEIANSFSGVTANSQSRSSDLPEYANLKQDYFGILCYVLLKKEITTSIEQFIEKVD